MEGYCTIVAVIVVVASPEDRQIVAYLQVTSAVFVAKEMVMGCSLFENAHVFAAVGEAAVEAGLKVLV